MNSSKPHIAFVTTNDAHAWGGSEEMWALTAHYMAEAGYRVGVSIRKWPKAIPKVEAIGAAGGHIYYRTQGEPEGVGAKIRARLQPYREKKIKIIRQQKWLDDHRPDMVVISMGHNFQGSMWMKACIDRNIPYVLLVHLASAYKWPNDSDAQPFIDGYSRAKKVYFVSEQNRTLTELQLGIKLTNTDLARNPYNVNFHTDISYPSTENGYKLATVASLSNYHKGHDLVLQVLNETKWKQRPLYLSLAGSGPHKENISRIISMYNLKNVEFLGFQSSIESIWEKHHGLIMGSRMEGLPLALVEAMLCSRMAIVTNVAGNSELVIDGETGFLAKAPTPELIDEAMENAWQKRDQWDQLGKNAVRKVKSIIPENPIEIFSQQLISILEQC